jgi:hypothetical protein
MKKSAIIFVCVLFAVFFARISNAATAHCDFNGDGYDDLAIGIPGEQPGADPDPCVDCDNDPLGAVSVIYGGPNGLSAAGNQFFEGEGYFGQTLACGDFNGDNISDLAIASPAPPYSSHAYVTILYGTKKWRLSMTGSQKFGLDPDIPMGFISALAAGDFNGDGFKDLAIGMGGTVVVGYGSSTGLMAEGHQVWDPSSVGDSDWDVKYSGFGNALVAADFGNDDASHCYDDLAIGAPQHTPHEEGAVHVLYGSASGLNTTGYQFWTEASPGIPGTAPQVAEFGATLAAGYFGNADSTCGKKIADLVVGAPHQNIGLAQGAGAVFAIYGTNSGLSPTNAQMWTQNTSGIADTAEGGDSFGLGLATGLKNSTGTGYLVIGVPRETIAGVSVGAIHILFTDAATGLLTAAGSKFIQQDTAGVKSDNKSGGPFGYALATGDFDGHGNDDVAVGIPFKTIDGVSDAGAVTILYNANTANTQFWNQNKPDMKDQADDSDDFGVALAQ